MITDAVMPSFLVALIPPDEPLESESESESESLSAVNFPWVTEELLGEGAATGELDGAGGVDAEGDEEGSKSDSGGDEIGLLDVSVGALAGVLLSGAGEGGEGVSAGSSGAGPGEICDCGGSAEKVRCTERRAMIA